VHRGRHLHGLYLSRCTASRHRRPWPAGTATALPGFGLASAVGTRLGGSAADRWGARITVILGGCLFLLAYLAFARRGPGTGSGNACPAADYPASGVGRLGADNRQAGPAGGVGPALAPVSISMNSSAIYLGGAMGAVMGALVIADGAAVARLGWIGFSLTALLSVFLSGNASGRG
jgi:predicted MFS family arabinose efflux permease